jgi:hypothetical protein
MKGRAGFGARSERDKTDRTVRADRADKTDELYGCSNRCSCPAAPLPPSSPRQ